MILSQYAISKIVHWNPLSQSPSMYFVRSATSNGITTREGILERFCILNNTIDANIEKNIVVNICMNSDILFRVINKY
jgi:hypothetical protein